MRKGDREHEAAEEVIAQFGRENLEAILDTYRAFVEHVDTKALLAWTIRDGIDDLLMPVFRAALLAIIKDLRLREISEQLAACPAPTPQCGATIIGLFGGTVGPCIHPAGHDGMHEEATPPGWPTIRGARWAAS